MMIRMATVEQIVVRMALLILLVVLQPQLLCPPQLPFLPAMLISKQMEMMDRFLLLLAMRRRFLGVQATTLMDGSRRAMHGQDSGRQAVRKVLVRYQQVHTHIHLPDTIATERHVVIVFLYKQVR